ncbi:MAG: DUF4381 family protein [Opitutales bacterium]
MLLLAQISAPGSSGGLPPLPEGPSLDRLRPPPGAESGPVSWQLLLILLALLAAIAWLILLYLKRSRKTPTPTVPDQAALAEIETARQYASSDLDLTVLCSGAVRRFLLQRYHLPHHGLTHEELTDRLPLPPAGKDQIRDFFNRCDLVKFSGSGLSEEDRHEILDTSVHLIHTHRKQEETQT